MPPPYLLVFFLIFCQCNLMQCWCELIGDLIAVYSKQADGWWQGELNGRVGVFPSTYVQELWFLSRVDSFDWFYMISALSLTIGSVKRVHSQQLTQDRQTVSLSVFVSYHFAYCFTSFTFFWKLCAHLLWFLLNQSTFLELPHFCLVFQSRTFGICCSGILLQIGCLILMHNQFWSFCVFFFTGANFLSSELLFMCICVFLVIVSLVVSLISTGAVKWSVKHFLLIARGKHKSLQD